MKAQILVIDDNKILLESMSMLLEREGLSHDTTTSPALGIEWIQERDYDLVISDMRMPEMTGLELIKMIKVYRPETEVIFITGYGSISSAVKAMSLGAYHYFTKPFANNDEFILVVRRALAKQDLSRNYQSLKQEMDRKYSFSNMVGQNEQMAKIHELIGKVAPSSAPILIQGESGTGKELVARAIHQRSRRVNKRFLAINTSSLPETLLESELFGYKKGSFTGAGQDKAGLLETSEGGTVFLDEISSMSRGFQGKLLRAVQENEIIPVGGSNPVPIDVRFISASNRNLKELVDEGEFREDLYYRLNVIEINIPPLRERTDDLMLLIEHFLRKFCEEQSVPLKKFSNEALKLLFSHDWPGNVRELENIIRRAVIMSDNKMLTTKDITIRRIDRNRLNDTKKQGGLSALTYKDAKREINETFQRQYVENLIDDCKGNISKAAEKSGLSRQALYKLIDKYKIEISKQHGSRVP
jgi:DNA-binding NtrC family response regulator